MNQAQDLRMQGNHLFRQQNEYGGALNFYTQALEVLSSMTNEENNENSSLIRDEKILNYCNRSACYFVIGEYEEAKMDSEKAWELSHKTSIKSAYRLAKALAALEDYENAKELIQHVLSLSTITEEENKTFQDIWNQILQASLTTTEKTEETSMIQFAKRPLSIREFTLQDALGFGNFSEIHIVVHKKTLERFALKKISKKQAADLAKRQHPNVYNEIQMERRILLERLPPTCPFVIHMFHAFTDYDNLYYLMELHDQNDDLWTQLRWKDKMVGCHRSQAKLWLYQLVLALEHLHAHGIVHRDIKAENILLNKRGHLVLIDFGTAKDLIQTDLNGPEFVGTPDFMSPEAVSGDSERKKASRKSKKKKKDDDDDFDPNKPSNKDEEDDDDDSTPNLGKAVWTADLWALGGLGYILQTGMTPFWTTSPYLAFLRIQRGLLTRPTGIIQDECWDWIQKLMKLVPTERLGAKAFRIQESENPKMTTIIQKKDPGGYTEIKEHPYLAMIHQQYTSSPIFRRQFPVPSLRDLCYRAVADMALSDCQDIDLCERHPPGDGSSHDLLRLAKDDRRAVLHLLDRQQLLRTELRLWSRFFVSNVESRLLAKIRPATRDVVGLTQMNDNQGQLPVTAESQQFEKKPKPPEPLDFVQICSPLLTTTTAESGDDAEQRKAQVKLFRKCIARINKVRPKLVIVSASVTVDDSCRKLLARINESIPVVFHETKTTDSQENDETFCTFWMSGVQGLMLSYRLAVAQSSLASPRTMDLQKEQMDWLREQLELSQTSKHCLFCFVNGPVQLGFPLLLLKKLARGRTLALFGPSAAPPPAKEEAQRPTSSKKRMKLRYAANEKVAKNAVWKEEKTLSDHNNNNKDDEDVDVDEDDLISVKSTDSEEDNKRDEFEMIMESPTDVNGITALRWIRVNPMQEEWSSQMEWIEE